MITPLQQTASLDLSDEPLPPAWFRRNATAPDPTEVPARGVWRTGPRLAFRGALVAALDSAREVALVSSFLLSDTALAEAMLRAADRGVRVYALTASKQRLAKVIGEDDQFDARMAKEHEALLDGLAGRVLLRSADHLHAKFVVVDPGAQARAWLSTANFNKGLAENVELGVELDAAAANAVAAHFRWAFWAEAEQELRSRGRLSAVNKSPAAPATPTATAGVSATVKGRTELRTAVLGLLRGARRELLVASYGLDSDHESVKALVEARARGVEVTVLTRPRKAVGPVARLLADAGVRIVAHDQLHAKAILADDRVIVMTANLQAHGLDTGFEVGVLLAATGAGAVRDTLREWVRTFPWEYRAQVRRGDHRGDLLLADLGLRGGEARVIDAPARPLALAAVTALDALDLASAPKPALVAPTSRAEFPRRVEFVWEVRPPTLPNGAKERLDVVELEVTEKDGSTRTKQERRPFEPRVFDHGGKVYVKLEKPGDRERARALATRLAATVVV
jgi:cardiolipin synthase